MGQPPTDPQSRIAALEALVAHTRHDVRSALAAAKLAAEMMQAHTDPRVRDYAAVVLRAIAHALEASDATHALVPRT